MEDTLPVLDLVLAPWPTLVEMYEQLGPLGFTDDQIQAYYKERMMFTSNALLRRLRDRMN